MILILCEYFPLLKLLLSLSLPEIVVAESVVVIKKLLQTQPAHHGEIIKRMAKLLDSITVSIYSILPLSYPK